MKAEMKSVTRECRKMIHDEKIRKCVTSIWKVYDEEDDSNYYLINFKENRVLNLYEMEYINYGTTAPITGRGAEYDINAWLDEIAYIEE